MGAVRDGLLCELYAKRRSTALSLRLSEIDAISSLDAQCIVMRMVDTDYEKRPWASPASTFHHWGVGLQPASILQALCLTDTAAIMMHDDSCGTWSGGTSGRWGTATDSEGNETHRGEQPFATNLPHRKRPPFLP